MASQASGSGALTPAQALLYGTVVLGSIDFAYASIGVTLMGRPWHRVWQFVASALLGDASFDGGYKTTLFGIVLHFAVAACVVGAYLVASRWLPVLGRRTVVGGLAYGVAVFLVMNVIVIPMTRIGPRPLVWSAFKVGDLLVHVLLLGPVAAYFAGRAAGAAAR